MAGKPLGPHINVGGHHPSLDTSPWAETAELLIWQTMLRPFYLGLHERLFWMGVPKDILDAYFPDLPMPLGLPLDLSAEWPVTIPEESRWRSHTWGWTHHQREVLLQTTGRPLRDAVEQDSQ